MDDSQYQFLDQEKADEPKIEAMCAKYVKPRISISKPGQSKLKLNIAKTEFKPKGKKTYLKPNVGNIKPRAQVREGEIVVKKEPVEEQVYVPQKESLLSVQTVGSVMCIAAGGYLLWKAYKGTPVSVEAVVKDLSEASSEMA
jgi:hypothetical protein